MNGNSLTCDDKSLLAMLREELSQDVSDDLLDHVESCVHCQQRLSDLVASGDEWKRATEAASGGSAELPSFEMPTLGQPPIAWTESMARQLLSPPSHPEMLGRLGRYEVERLIGAGGMGVVFKAYDGELNRPVAIKLLAPYLASSGPARKRFAREARAAAAVVHQHVVPIHNVETDRDSPLIVMQFVSGESLQARIDREGPLELCEILRIGMQVADGLSAAHHQGLVHRDIKPSNILLEEKVDRALISDFGLARAADDGSLTRTGFHPGTPQYMSPEQASGQSVDARSDLFSLGSMLYTMCTGRPPFRAENSLGVMRRITESKPTPIQEINPEIPGWLCCLVGKLMEKQQADRFQSAGEVHELLEHCLSHIQQPLTNPLPSALQVHQPFPSKHKTMKLILGGIIFSSLVLAAFVGQMVRSHNTAQAEQVVRAPLSVLDGIIDSMMNSPHDSVFLNLGAIGKDENYLCLEPTKDGVSMRFPAFDKTSLSRRQGKYVEKLRSLSQAFSLTVHERSEVSPDGTVGGVNFEFHVTGDPNKVAVTIKQIIEQTFQVDDSEECSFQYRNMPSVFSVKDGQAPKQVSAAAFLSEAETGNRVYLGEQVRRIFLIPPALKSRSQVQWDQDLWYTDVRELSLDDLNAIRKGTVKVSQTKAAPADQESAPSNGGREQRDKILTDHDAIQGTWRVIFAEDSGRTGPPEALRDIRFVITKDKVTMESGGRKQESTYTLDPSTSPKSIDLTSSGRTKPGIYDLQGDTLRICISENTDKRPTAFDSQPDSVNDVVLTMKRMTPEALDEKLEQGRREQPAH